MKKSTLKFLINTVSSVVALFLIFIIPASASSVLETGEIPFESYTYWNDMEKTAEAVPMRPIYETDTVIDAEALGTEAFKKLTDVCTDKDGRIYLLDGDASALYILNSDYSLASVISCVISGNEKLVFEKAKGVFVDSDLRIYIADTEHGRVLISNQDGMLLRQINKPVSDQIPENFEFRPIKITTDSSGNVYILSDGSFYGAMLFDSNGEFLSFYGANKVASGVKEALENLYNRIFMNNEKRASLTKQLPYQFTDLYADNAGFIYTATGQTNAYSSNEKGQIKRMNPGGYNVLLSEDVSFGDQESIKVVTKDGSETRNKDLLSLAVDKDGFVYALDSVYGRIFVYDSDNRLLGAFGGGVGNGTQKGSFYSPCAIDLYGDKVFVCDTLKNTLTVFDITYYGALLKEARLLTLKGEYAESESLWREVLKLDGNSQLAYIGLAYAYLELGDIESAEEYAKIGLNREVYEQVFKTKRTDFLQQNFAFVALGVIAAVVLCSVSVAVIKKRGLLKAKNPVLAAVGSVLPHPVTTFGDIKEKKLSSPVICVLILAVYLIMSILETTAGGFLFTNYDPAEFNSLLILFRTAFPVALWTLVNYAVCTLMGGKGRMREIFTVASFSIIPLIIYSVFFVILSNVLVPDEATILDIIRTLAIIYAGFMLVVGTMRIHDYGLGDFIKTSLITVLGMAVIVFLVFIVVSLIQQFGGFIATVITEIFYR